MALDAQVARFATMCKLDPKVEGWFVQEGILDCEGVASLAAKEDMVDPKFIQVLIASGLDEMKSSGKQIALTKFWRKCRTAFGEAELQAKEMAKPKAAKADIPHSTDQEIPPVDAATIISA